jgi:hypothetical protein
MGKYGAADYDYVTEGVKAGKLSKDIFVDWPGGPGKSPRPSFNAVDHFVRHVKRGGVFVAPGAGKGDLPLPTEPDLAQISREEQDKLKREYDQQTLRLFRRERASTDRIIDAIIDASPRIPPVTVPLLPDPGGPHHEQTATLLFSDLHVGANTDIEETGGLGEYNYPIFRERLASLRDGVRSITAHHRMSHPVKNLVVQSLGDNIENVTIFPAQRDAADDLTEQVLRAQNDIAEFYLGLLDTFEHISVIAVSGNHGRIGRKGEFKHHVNWDFIINKSLAARLEDATDRITFQIPKAPFAAVDIEGWVFLLRHGDGIKSWNSIPYYGVARSTGRWIAIQESLGNRFDYMSMGHFHQMATLPYTGGEVLMNGSFVGSSQFSVEVMETLSRPVQLFGMVHPTHGLAARYPIHLDKGRGI